MQKIKIGQIGIGHNHGKGKMSAVRKRPDIFEVVGYAEENEDWVNKRGDLPCYEGLPRLSVDELLDKCDAVIIETDVWNLTKTAQRAADKGCHIHMDKPASGSYEEYEKLLKTCKEKGLVLQLGYMFRTNNGFLECKKRIESGEIGEIYSIHSEISTDHEPEFREWLNHFPGGIMNIMGSHMIDLSLLLLGEPKNVVSFLKSTEKDGVKTTDNALAVLEYDKALATISASSVEINGYGRRQFVVSGSKGKISLVPMEKPLTVYWTDRTIADNAYENKEIVIEMPEQKKGSRYDALMQTFYDDIVSGNKESFDFEHELLLHKVIGKITGGYIK